MVLAAWSLVYLYRLAVSYYSQEILSLCHAI